MPRPRPVDLDLDALAPKHLTFRKGGEVYEIPGDLAVETVIEAIQLRNTFQESSRSQRQAENLLHDEIVKAEELAGRELTDDEVEELENIDEIQAQIRLSEDAMTSSMDQLQALVRNMLDDVGLDGRPYPRLGIGAVSSVITLALNGEPDQSPEGTVADALRGDLPAAADDPGSRGRSGDGEHPTGQERPVKARSSRSPKRSPAPSSG